MFFGLICYASEAASTVKTALLSKGKPVESSLSHLVAVAEAEEPIHLILIEKNLQRLRVFEYDGELRVVAEYFSATGENFGIKEVSGDSKTPEGIYFITKVFIDNEITVFGDKAFHLDYPNFFDIEAGRNGDGIYIHGTNTELKPYSTNGCVTMANDDLDDLEKYLDQAVTPVVIVSELKPDRLSINRQLTGQDFHLAKTLLLNEDIKPAKVEYNYLYVINLGAQAVAVADFVYRPYENSMMRGTSRSYLEFYSEKGWTTRKRIWRTTPLIIYPDSQVKIAARPFAAEQVQIAGQPALDTSTMVASLELSSQPDANSSLEMEIQGQTQPEPPSVNIPKPAFQPQQVPDKNPINTASDQESKPETIAVVAINNTVPTEQPVLAVAAPAEPTVFPRDDESIRKFVENWRLAWISQEIEPYINHYDATFRQGDKDLSQYKAHKAKLNRKYQFIKVGISQIEINWTKKGATVSFQQEYQSDLYKTTGSKTLILVHKDDGWKIKREMYSGKKS